MHAQTPLAEPLWKLLYRYLWPFQYFRDVNRGSRMERQQNYRHNRAMRVHLPGFMAKWVLLTATWFAFGGLMEAAFDSAIPAACCFMTGSWAFTVVVLLAAAWIWLERFPELF